MMIDVIRGLFKKRCGANCSSSKEGCADDLHIATCALFLEMAAIDGEFNESEQEHILMILKREYHLSDISAAALVEAAHKEVAESIDLWQFTRLINENYSDEDKIKVVEMLWKIVYADGNIDAHERYLVGKIANLLHLGHKDLINAKLKVTHSGR